MSDGYNANISHTRSWRTLLVVAWRVRITESSVVADFDNFLLFLDFVVVVLIAAFDFVLFKMFDSSAWSAVATSLGSNTEVSGCTHKC